MDKKRKSKEEVPDEVESNNKQCYEFEKSFILENRTKMLSKCCKLPVKSMGQNGSCHQSGLQVIQVKCTNPKCTQRQVLKNFLKNTELFSKYWSEIQKYEILGQQLVAKQNKHGNINAFLKNQHMTDDDIEMQTEKTEWADEPVTTATVLNDSAEEPLAKTYHELLKEMNQIKEERDAIKKERDAIKEERDLLKNELEQIKKNMITREDVLKIIQDNAKKEIPPPNQSQKLSYASAVKEQPKPSQKPFSKQALQRKVVAMMKPKTDPINFERILFKLNDARPITSCKTFREVRCVVHELFKALQIGNAVFQWSKIGRSLLEIIVPQDVAKDVKWKLYENDMDVKDEIKLWEAPEHMVAKDAQEKFVTRIANMYAFARLTRIKECHLRGVPHELQELIKIRAEAIAQLRNATNMEPTEGGAMDVANTQ